MIGRAMHVVLPTGLRMTEGKHWAGGQIPMWRERRSSWSWSAITVHGAMACALSLFASFSTCVAGGLSEHEAAMGLVPVAEATHTAVADGAWSSPATWSGAQVPDTGARVFIPVSRRVTFDVSVSPDLQWLRVDGELDWATTFDTELRVDTVVAMGALRIGTQAEPIRPDATARIIFTDAGALDMASDPLLLGRGLIAMGPLQAWGDERMPRFLPLPADVMAGATSFDVGTMPRGWRVGDTVVIAGTRYTGVLYTFPMSASDDEVRRIVAIEGNTLVLDAPLARDHTGLTARDWARPHVANLSCNIVFDSAAGAATPVPRRGHVMLMEQDSQIENACFHHLGRTDKSIPVDDPVTNQDGSPGSGTNPRGRYSLHIHRIGTDHAQHWMRKPLTVRGCVVMNSPGWGIAVHQSHAVVEDCAFYAVFGAHFVTEDGNEQGAFRRNIAIWSQGDIADRGYKEGVDNHDLAHSGCGFWLQGRDFGVEDNVAAGMGDAGFCWFHRSLVFDGDNPMRVFLDNLSRPMRQLLHLRTPLTVGETAYGEFFYNDVPITQVRNNLAYASGTGHRVTKANPLQLGDQFSILEGLKSFATDEGLFHEYTQHYFYDALETFGNAPDNSFRIGITSWSQADHLVLRNPSVSGYGQCLRTGQFFGMDFDYPNILLLDPVFGICPVQWQNHAPDNPQGSRQTILAAAALEDVDPVFAPADDQDFTLAFNPAQFGNDFILRGTVSDGSGTWPLELQWPGPHLAQHLADAGYHTRPDGSRVLRLETQLHGRADPHRVIDHVFEVTLPQPYGNALGPDNGLLPAYVANAAPVAQDHHYEVSPDAGYRIDIVPASGLLAGAQDAESDALQVYLMYVEDPPYGSVSVAPNGGFTYRRDVRSHDLPDTFGYRIHDTRHGSQRAVVTLTVAAVDAVFRDGFE